MTSKVDINAGGCKLIAIANQKGGVGKTTTAVNIATALVAIGRSSIEPASSYQDLGSESSPRNRVLLIDCDSQGNATTSFGIVPGERRRNLYELLTTDAKAEGVCMSTSVEGLDIIASTIDLAAVDSELGSMKGKEFILRRKLASLHAKYQYIIFDCPPSLSVLTLNALAAASRILIPMQCEFLAMEGIGYLLNTIKLIKRGINPHLEIDGIVITMFDKRNRISHCIVEEVRNELGSLVYKTVIPRNVKLSEAPSHGQPAVLYDPNCAGSVYYMMLVRELLERNSLG